MEKVLDKKGVKYLIDKIKEYIKNNTNNNEFILCSICDTENIIPGTEEEWNNICKNDFEINPDNIIEYIDLYKLISDFENNKSLNIPLIGIRYDFKYVFDNTKNHYILRSKFKTVFNGDVKITKMDDSTTKTIYNLNLYNDSIRIFFIFVKDTKKIVDVNIEWS